MKPETRIGQVWTIEGEMGEWEILGLYMEWMWVQRNEHFFRTVYELGKLKTMIRDEHGNKPTEENDDVWFYDVVEDGDGPYGVKDKNVGGLVFTTDGVIPLADLLGCKDEDGRTCVAFMYERDGGAYYLSSDPISMDFARVGMEGEVEAAAKKGTFRIPVKAVFKRLEARS